MELLLSVCIGLGLSAACGFRVFVPMLFMGLAAHTGHLSLSEEWLWLASTPALFAFGAATLLEIGGYYIPWVDNLLDTVATPAAVVAGVMSMSAVIQDTSPLLTWSIAVIGGGGSAAVVQVGTGLGRQVSSFTTGGLGNPILSTLELVGSVFMSVLAILLPIFAVAALGFIIYVSVRLFQRVSQRKTATSLA